MKGYCTRCKEIREHKSVPKGYRCLKCNKVLTIDFIKREAEGYGKS